MATHGVAITTVFNSDPKGSKALAKLCFNDNKSDIGLSGPAPIWNGYNYYVYGVLARGFVSTHKVCFGIKYPVSLGCCELFYKPKVGFDFLSTTVHQLIAILDCFFTTADMTTLALSNATKVTGPRIFFLLLVFGFCFIGK